MEFDLVGVDASIANALRRIMYAEVPTMAMETVYYTMNDSVMSDEVLANRIGLVPLKVDPRHFTAKSEGGIIGVVGRRFCYALSELTRRLLIIEDASTDLNTLVFEMSSKGSSPAMRGSLAVRLMSSQIKWIPQGTQQARFAEPFPGHDNAGPGLKKIRDAFADYWQEQTRAAAAVGKKKKKDAAPLLVHPVHNDIVVAKINRSDTIQAQIHAVRGIGREHAKWTPVELANYRLLPRITITAPIEGEAAVRFQRCFEPGVIEVVEEKRGKDVVKVARVAETRNCGMTRECQRHKEFVDKVELARVRNHFICMGGEWPVC